MRPKKGFCAAWVLVGVLEGEGEAVPRSPKMPGLRWCSGRIALNRCVIMVAPAAMPARASSYVASECPIATVMFSDVSAEMQESALGSSGARVRSLMGEGDVRLRSP